MAALILSVSTAEIALSAATLKTVLRIKAAANQRLKLLRWGVTFDGASPTAEPVQVRLLRQSTDGTFTSVTPVPTDGSLTETPQTTAGHTATVEPTPGAVIEPFEVHPQGGLNIIYPFGQEVIVPGGGRLAIDCTAPAVVNVRAFMIFEE